MIVSDLPLLELFIRLRKADLPLGIHEYQQVLHALQAGFGISDRAALKRLCRTLWVKSADESRLFEYHFEQLVPEPIKNEIPPQLPESLAKRLETQSSTDAATPPPSVSTVSDTSQTLLSSDPTTSTYSAIVPEKTATLEMSVTIEDEVQVAQAISQTVNIDDAVPGRHYITSDEYFPVTRRQMKQSWRYLRRAVREGPPKELDIEATVDEVGRKGMLVEPVFVPQRVNRAELLLLIDHGGSMVPFHILSRRLMETALRGGRLRKVDVYYFHNCPVEYLYRDSVHREFETFEEILCGRYSQWAGVMVFSDAGAARGGFNPERIDLTKQFLKRFRQRFRYIAWLNPMPRSRWFGSTAGAVMQSVPMFDLSRRGLDDSIVVLQGHPFRSKA